jgi:ubiquinone/menaquinone biosynthesis C-methylase UbiE
MRMLARCSLAILIGLLLVATRTDARQAAPAQSSAQAALTAEVTRLIQLLELGPESALADIGAGSGEVSIEVARQLGPRSRVYSTDIASKQLAEIKDAATKAGLTNVTVVEGAPAATNLPDECCDAVFVRNVYHHFGDPPTMNASILRALKPGGRFVVIDFAPRVAVTIPVSPAERASGDKHGVIKETVIDELKSAGFEIVQVIPDWSGVSFLVLARKLA